MAEIKTTLKKVVVGIHFAVLAKALDGMSNVGSYIQEEVNTFLKDNGLMGIPHVFMATHSMGGRNWEFEEDHEPVFYEEAGFNGGWYICREEDVNYLYCDSATSGSSLRAEKQRDGTWVVTLEVPVGEDGRPYEGFYWRCFHEAFGLEKLLVSA